ncbi:hypothetical protein SC1_02520 [Sphingopyxis sp. C-1]|nr:hypothetical protein SC1_02520 [Sphingopyxis sp. C-1]
MMLVSSCYLCHKDRARHNPGRGQGGLAAWRARFAALGLAFRRESL